jgi:UDP-N-acetylmuramate dehydrogenase
MENAEFYATKKNMSLIQENHDLKSLNWLKVGGTARYFAAVTSVDELKEALKFALNKKLPYWVISGGSNVLVRDGVLEGLVISLHSLVGVEQTQIPTADTPGEVRLTVLAGTPKSEVAKIFLQNRLAPAVFLTGIPGDIGGGVVMNAGIGEMRVPREFCEIVKSIEVLRLKSEGVHPNDTVLRSDELFNEIQISAQHITWEYRHSSGWQPGVITRVTVGCAYTPEKSVMDDVKVQTKKRISSQPLELPNCGSVFRNPLGHKSAQLIEGCGLKGYRVGGASVSTKHANFIVNDKGATAADIKDIIQHVRKTVLDQKGVELATEVVYIG